MSGWLLDTNILSELRKPRPAAAVTAFIAATAAHHSLTIVSRDTRDYEKRGCQR